MSALTLTFTFSKNIRVFCIISLVGQEGFNARMTMCYIVNCDDPRILADFHYNSLVIFAFHSEDREFSKLHNFTVRNVVAGWLHFTSSQFS